MKKNQKIYLALKRFIAIIGSLIGIILMMLVFWWWIFPINAIATKGHPSSFTKDWERTRNLFI